MKKMVKGIVCLVFAASCLGYVVSGSAVSGSPSQAKKGKKSQGQVLAQGKTLYVANCARCHGGDGLGQTSLGEMVDAPDLTDAKWQSKRSNNRIATSIIRGREQMPAFGNKLSKDEIAALVLYVRTFRK